MGGQRYRYEDGAQILRLRPFQANAFRTPHLCREKKIVAPHFSEGSRQLKPYSPEVTDANPEEHHPATCRESPRSTLQTQHIQKRRTTKPIISTITPPPPRNTAEIPSRTIPVRHRPARNHQPEDPSNRRHRNRKDRPHTTLRNRHHPDSQDAQAEPSVCSHQLSRIPRQPLHDPQKGPPELHTPIPPARILQRRTTTHTTRPIREQEPTHHPHTRRSRRTDQSRGIDQPLQSHKNTGGASRPTSQTITNRHNTRTTEPR